MKRAVSGETSDETDDRYETNDVNEDSGKRKGTVQMNDSTRQKVQVSRPYRLLAVGLAAVVLLLPLGPVSANERPATRVSSVVVYAQTGEPAVEVTVRVIDMGTAETVLSALTSEEGTVEFLELPFGLYQVSVAAPEGFADAAGPLVYLLPETPAATVEIALETIQDQDEKRMAAGGLALLPIIIGAVGGAGALAVVANAISG